MKALNPRIARFHHSSGEKIYPTTKTLLQNLHLSTLQKKITKYPFKALNLLLLISFTFPLPQKYLKDLDPEDNPDQYIAVYECIKNHLKLVWHAPNLTPQKLKELKKIEGEPCKKQE